MKLFQLINNERAVPSDECFMIKAFADVINEDKDKTKDTATKWLAFVYHMCDWSSPYQMYNNDIREDKLIDDLFGKKVKVPKTVVAAMEKYKELKDTDSIKMLRSARSAAQKLQDYFDEIDFTTSEDTGKVAKDLIANIGNLGKVLDGIKTLEERVKKEQQEEVVVRKGVEITEFNSGDD